MENNKKKTLEKPIIASPNKIDIHKQTCFI